MTSITTAIYLTQGLSPLFFLAFALSIVIFRDAAGVRLESGKQAEMINDIVKKLKIKEQHLKELIGHTKKQVYMGIITGVLITLLFYVILYM